LGEVFGVGIRDDALSLIAEFELRIPEESVVGGRDKTACHFQDGVSRTRSDACRQLLSLLFKIRAEGF
jgi:hypothetical protein